MELNLLRYKVLYFQGMYEKKLFRPSQEAGD